MELSENILQKDKLQMVPTRNGYGEGLLKAGKDDENVVALCADLTDSTRTEVFRKKFPNRFVEVGITEQSMANIASGMAAAGKIPFIASYAMFSPGRNWEQIRTTICYNDTNVKICGAHAGVSVGPDGATHQAIEDMAITRVIPNMTVIAPCDAIESRKATIAAAGTRGPVYLRFARSASPVFTVEETPFQIGKAEIFRQGKDVAIIACGPLVHNAILAAEKLSKDGIEPIVVNNHTIKPMDKDLIINVAKETGRIVTVEEHSVIGGMGSAVAEILAQNFAVPIEFIGTRDRFGESGKPDELIEEFGLGVEHIMEAVKKVLKR